MIGFPALTWMYRRMWSHGPLEKDAALLLDLTKYTQKYSDGCVAWKFATFPPWDICHQQIDECLVPWLGHKAILGDTFKGVTDSTDFMRIWSCCNYAVAGTVYSFRNQDKVYNSNCTEPLVTGLQGGTMSSKPMFVGLLATSPNCEWLTWLFRSLSTSLPVLHITSIGVSIVHVGECDWSLNYWLNMRATFSA